MSSRSLSMTMKIKGTDAPVADSKNLVPPNNNPSGIALAEGDEDTSTSDVSIHEVYRRDGESILTSVSIHCNALTDPQSFHSLIPSDSTRTKLIHKRSSGGGEAGGEPKSSVSGSLARIEKLIGLMTLEEALEKSHGIEKAIQACHAEDADRIEQVLLKYIHCDNPSVKDFGAGVCRLMNSMHDISNHRKVHQYELGWVKTHLYALSIIWCIAAIAITTSLALLYYKQ